MTEVFSLHHVLSKRVDEWRIKGYPVDEYPVIGEILEWANNPGGNGFRLRPSQVRALETYWYLRLVEGTPHIFELYRRLFSKTADLLNALGVSREAFEQVDYNLDDLWEKIKTDDVFVRNFRLESLRETFTLRYPSYIFALAMGAGKTALIGAIIATEFAMALEYPDGPFVQNALVFAPGKTIVESLRELTEIPYNRILPPRFYKPFAASVKLTFTRDGEKDIPVIPRSSFNVVVTNTEKIRIQKEAIRKSDLGSLFVSEQKQEEARAEIANLRLQKIASLPNLAVFSDEAHHTYGQALGTELKKVRKTVDYLSENTSLICVVNTTGTPYFQRQPLRDVVIWYSLSQGIRDGILKEVAGNIFAFDFDHANAHQFVGYVIEDFFKDYGNVTLPNGAPAKLAFYFPRTDDLEELRPVIEAKLKALGYSPSIVLRNTNESTREEIDAFNRLNDPAAPHRVILLVNKGTEGWNCPSLFACALVRRLRSSNNFVLQAATRCLRQVPGNVVKARIYLSMDNRNTLERELQETYGETIAQLNQTESKYRRTIIHLRKVSPPPLVVKQIMRTVVRKETKADTFSLAEIHEDSLISLKKVTFTVAEQATWSVLKQVSDTIEIAAVPDTIDIYTAAVELATVYRVDLWKVYDELKRLYGSARELPVTHLPHLARQIEEQTRDYEVHEETVEMALALVKPEGFHKEISAENTEIYTAEISYPVDREHLLLSWETMKSRNKNDFGFHYTPYNFDSNPEKSFFEQMLDHLNLHPDEVEDIYFTGGLTDPKKTDFYVEYRGDDNKWHRYTPDFIIRRKDGKTLIVEIKDARFEVATREDLSREERGEVALTVEGRKVAALKKWEQLNPERLKYHIVFVKGNVVGYDQTKESREFVEGINRA